MTLAKELEQPSYQEDYPFPWIVSVESLANFRIRLQYSDGVQGDLDVSHCVGTELFSEWDKPGVFEQVRIGDFGEVWWTDRASFCPDALYLELTGKTFEQVVAT